MPREIANRRPQVLNSVMEHPKTLVAVTTQEATYFPGNVVVIYGQVPSHHKLWTSTDCAQAILLFEQSLVLLDGDARSSEPSTKINELPILIDVALLLLRQAYSMLLTVLAFVPLYLLHLGGVVLGLLPRILPPLTHLFPMTLSVTSGG